MNTRIFRALALLGASLALPAAGHAATYLVDAGGGGDFLAIQPALTAATSGDTVLVAAGTYGGTANNNLNFGGKGIVLRAPLGANVTIIDGGGVAGGFRFASGETGAAVVDGFTITHAPDGSPIRAVGGASPTLRNCVIRDNAVTNSAGGAIHLVGSSATFTDCTIVQNSCASHAGGVYAQGGAPAFVGCTIVGNTTSGRGGGFWLEGGAAATITRCTISGNSADLGGTGLAGGGLVLTGATTAAIARTIIWGNRAGQGDDLFVAANAAATITCSDVDGDGTGGAGNIIYGQGVLFSDPHFCLPAYCRQSPWSDGEYTLAANSPCLAANNACGVSIGALGLGCGAVTVWTGAAGTTDWNNPLNWSSHAIPGPGDEVQITKGNVRLDVPARIARLTQCPEASTPDTLVLAAGSHLTLGDLGPLADKAQPKESTFSSVTKSEDGEADTAGGTPPPLITVEGIFDILHGRFSGSATWENEGRMTVSGGGHGDFDAPLENRGRGTGGLKSLGALAAAPRGLFILGGTVETAAPLTNLGDLEIAGGSTLTLGDSLVNRADGAITLGGAVAGAGPVANLGLIARGGPGVSGVAAPLVNQRQLAPPRAGELRLDSGALTLAGSFTNHGQLTVGAGATLAFAGPIANAADGVVTLGGNLAGAGRLDNLGLLQRTGAGTSSVTPLLANGFDTATADQGALEVVSGMLAAGRLDNDGRVTVDAGATLTIGDVLDNRPRGILRGGGTLDVSTGALSQDGAVSPGASPGRLTVVGDFASGPQSVLRVEIDGGSPGASYDQLRIVGPAALGGALQVRVSDAFQPAAGDSFAIVTFTTGAAPAAAFARRLTSPFACVSGTQLAGGLWLDPVPLSDRLVLVARQGATGNQPPAPQRDDFTIGLVPAASLAALANDHDPDGDPLSLVTLGTAATQGAAYIAGDGVTIVYLPPAGFVGRDSLTYDVTDCLGAVATSTVVVDVADLTDAPGAPPASPGEGLVAVAPNPFNPRTRVRFRLAAAGDVRLAVYDARGRRVALLADGWTAPGDHARDWDGRDARGRDAPSGIYFVRLLTPTQSWARKLILLR